MGPSCGVKTSCGAWAQLQHMGLVVPQHVGGILVPLPGIEPVSPALQGRFLTTGPPGNSREVTRFR